MQQISKYFIFICLTINALDLHQHRMFSAAFRCLVVRCIFCRVQSTLPDPTRLDSLGVERCEQGITQACREFQLRTAVVRTAHLCMMLAFDACVSNAFFLPFFI